MKTVADSETIKPLFCIMTEQKKKLLRGENILTGVK